MLVRVQGREVRVLLSDVTAAAEWPLAAAVMDLLDLPEPDDEEDPQPAGEMDIVADLGVAADRPGAAVRRPRPLPRRGAQRRGPPAGLRPGVRGRARGSVGLSGPGDAARGRPRWVWRSTWRGEALQSDDVPVGALVLDPAGRLLASAHNVRERDGDPTGHAELVALRAAAAARGGWRLDGCTLVVTLEPCTMCAGAVVLSRLDRLVFGAFDPKAGAVGSLWDVVRDRRLNHRPEVVVGRTRRRVRGAAALVLRRPPGRLSRARPAPVPCWAVACPSGRRSTPRKRVRVCALRGFKSHRHRQRVGGIGAGRRPAPVRPMNVSAGSGHELVTDSSQRFRTPGPPAFPAHDRRRDCQARHRGGSEWDRRAGCRCRAARATQRGQNTLRDEYPRP